MGWNILGMQLYELKNKKKELFKMKKEETAISLILEWFDINILKINHYICIVQVVVITGIMIAL